MTLRMSKRGGVAEDNGPAAGCHYQYQRLDLRHITYFYYHQKPAELEIKLYVDKKGFNNVFLAP
jgi:hypothetical protein